MENRTEYAQCGICKRSFEAATLLQSSSDEFYCKDCFKKTLRSANKLYGAGDNKTEVVNRIGTKMIPHPEMYVHSSQTLQLIHGSQSLNSMSLSKRPLQCPKADCNKYISVCTLESHFKREHVEIPIVSTHLDARFASEFFPRDIRYCITQCIVILKVMNTVLSNACQISKMTLTGLSPEEQKPVMVLMSTRIAAIHLEKYDEDEDNKSPERAGMSSADEIFRKGDRIIVWLASNITTNLSYTAAVSTLDNGIRQKYFGPMLTLNESPEKLCKEGNCLMLTHLHCIGMTDNGRKPLALDVVIHGPD